MNPYSTLGVPDTSDIAAIRDAYRAKAKLYHPDVSTFLDAQERFILITQAYDLLSDPVKKSRFDRLLKAQEVHTSTKRSQERHEQDLRRSRAQAEKQAAAFSRMSYDRFDKELLSETVSYYGPKMLGCFGIFIAELFVFLICAALVFHFNLPTAFIIIPIFVFIPLGAWLSTGFDDRHERRRKRR